MSNRAKKIAPNKKQKLRSKSSTDAVKPGWDSTINDLTVHKLTSSDVERRKSGRGSRSESAKCTKSSVDAKKVEERQEEMLRSLFAGSGRAPALPGRRASEKTLSVVRSVFEDKGKRYRGLPNVTRNPESVGVSLLPVASVRADVESEDSGDWNDDLDSELVDVDFPQEEEEEERDEVKPKTSREVGVSCVKSPQTERSKAEGDVPVQMVDDRTRGQVEELRKLVDALTLELISTNSRLSAVSQHFSEYKQTSEKRIKSLEEQVQALTARKEHSELVLDLAPVLDGDSSEPDLSEPSEESGPQLHRSDILAQLEELQRQRDLAQARLQAIADL